MRRFRSKSGFGFIEILLVLVLILFLFSKVAKTYFKEPLADADKETVKFIQDSGIDIAAPVTVMGTARQKIQDVQRQQQQRSDELMGLK